jgi:hypothetical protein
MWRGKMLSFYELLRMYGINPEKIKLVRHGNAEIPILETYKNRYDLFEAYQSFEASNKFKESKAIAVFAPSRGTTALFLGYWDILSSIKSEEFTNKHLSLIEKYNFPESWKIDNEWYELKRNTVLDELSERLVIDWGKSTVSWVQAKDKEILEIKGKNSVDDFISYDDIQLSFIDLKNIIGNIDSNYTWFSALSAVNGIYLIRDVSTGKLYVGSAYGEDGIWGRWKTYSSNGHGGNLELKNIKPENMEFSILEIISSITSVDHVIERENRWKVKLGTREFGLNKN